MPATPFSPRRSPLLLLLSALLLLLNQGAHATPTSPSFREGTIKIIQSRQDAAAAVLPVGTPLNVAVACAQYARIANMSAIGSNSTLRATFMDVSPVGTLFNAAMLSQAVAELPQLTADVALNQACGNLTTVATTEAANNFTRGIVGQFSFTGSHTSIVNGPVIGVITIAGLLIMLGPISAL